ncbi:MAG: hypothetical protein ACPLPR_02215 [Bacillota bacterium]
MEVNEQIAHITCKCGAKFQVLNADGADWDEQATAEAYREHLRQVHGEV